MKMEIGGTIKAGMAGLIAVLAWVNTNFGETLYILAALLVLDAVLNYANEKAYMQKVGVFTVSTASAFYIQNASMAGIPMAKGLMVLLAVHELTQVTQNLKDRYKEYQISKAIPEPQGPPITEAIDQIAAQVLAKLQEQKEAPRQ